MTLSKGIFHLLNNSQQSNLHNAARLRVLKEREDHVGSVLEDAKRRLAEVVKDRSQYKELLENLMAQGLLQVFYLCI